MAMALTRNAFHNVSYYRGSFAAVRKALDQEPGRAVNTSTKVEYGSLNVHYGSILLKNSYQHSRPRAAGIRSNQLLGKSEIASV